MARVLIVDDEPDIRFMMRIIFERAGHEVREAANGVAALSEIVESMPDLVVTDMMMPLMDGAELIERLRADPETASIPILAVSAHTRRIPGADLGLDKPFEPGRLVEMASSLLHRHEGI